MKCDKCGKKATVNYQKIWVKYKVKGDDGYSKRFLVVEGCDCPDGDDNIHMCHSCEVKWLEGEW